MMRFVGNACRIQLIAALLLLQVAVTQGCSRTPPPLTPSKKTVAQATAHLKPGMTTQQLLDYLNTTPILVKDNRFHWELQDGSLWTDFNATPSGLVIVATQSQLTSPPMPAPALPAGMTVDEIVAIEKWLNDYYLHPDPDNLVERTLRAAAVYRVGGSDFPATVFVSEAMRKHPDRLTTWTKELSSATVPRDAIVDGIWMLGTPEARRALEVIRDSAKSPERERISNLLSTSPPDLRTQPLIAHDLSTTAQNMDANWCAFFATGDSWPVDRVFEVLTAEAGVLSKADHAKAQGTALWSIGAIADRHPALRAIVEQKLPRLDSSMKARVRESLDSAGASVTQPN